MSSLFEEVEDTLPVIEDEKTKGLIKDDFDNMVFTRLANGEFEFNSPVTPVLLEETRMQSEATRLAEADASRMTNVRKNLVEDITNKNYDATPTQRVDLYNTLEESRQFLAERDAEIEMVRAANRQLDVIRDLQNKVENEGVSETLLLQEQASYLRDYGTESKAEDRLNNRLVNGVVIQSFVDEYFPRDPLLQAEYSNATLDQLTSFMSEEEREKGSRILEELPAEFLRGFMSDNAGEIAELVNGLVEEKKRVDKRSFLGEAGKGILAQAPYTAALGVGLVNPPAGAAIGLGTLAYDVSSVLGNLVKGSEFFAKYSPATYLLAMGLPDKSSGELISEKVLGESLDKRSKTSIYTEMATSALTLNGVMKTAAAAGGRLSSVAAKLAQGWKAEAVVDTAVIGTMEAADRADLGATTGLLAVIGAGYVAGKATTTGNILKSKMPSGLKKVLDVAESPMPLKFEAAQTVGILYATEQTANIPVSQINNMITRTSLVDSAPIEAVKAYAVKLLGELVSAPVRNVELTTDGAMDVLFTANTPRSMNNVIKQLHKAGITEHTIRTTGKDTFVVAKMPLDMTSFIEKMDSPSTPWMYFLDSTNSPAGWASTMNLSMDTAMRNKIEKPVKDFLSNMSRKGRKVLDAIHLKSAAIQEQWLATVNTASETQPGWIKNKHDFIQTFGHEILAGTEDEVWAAYSAQRKAAEAISENLNITQRDILRNRGYHGVHGGEAFKKLGELFGFQPGDSVNGRIITDKTKYLKDQTNQISKVYAVVDDSGTVSMFINEGVTIDDVRQIGRELPTDAGTLVHDGKKSLSQVASSDDYVLIELEPGSVVAPGRLIGASRDDLVTSVAGIFYKKGTEVAPVLLGDVVPSNKMRVLPGTQNLSKNSYVIRQVHGEFTTNGAFAVAPSHISFSARSEKEALKFAANETKVVASRNTAVHLRKLREQLVAILESAPTKGDFVANPGKTAATQRTKALGVAAEIQHNLAIIEESIKDLPSAIQAKVKSALNNSALRSFAEEVIASHDVFSTHKVSKKLADVLKKELDVVISAAQKNYEDVVQGSKFVNDPNLLPAKLGEGDKIKAYKTLMESNSAKDKVALYEALVNDGYISETSSFASSRRGAPLPDSTRIYSTGIGASSDELQKLNVIRGYDSTASHARMAIDIPIDGVTRIYNPSEIMSRQMGALIRHGAFDAWYDTNMRKAMREYGDIIEGFNPNDPSINWDTFFQYGRVADSATDARKLAFNRMREAILQQMNIPTGLAKKLESTAINIGNKLFEYVPEEKTLINEIVRDMASGLIRQDAAWNSPAKLTAFAKIVNAHMMLGAFNITQVYKQATQVVHIAAISPGNVVKGMARGSLLKQLLIAGGSDKFIDGLVQSGKLASREDGKTLYKLALVSDLDVSSGNIAIGRETIRSKDMTMYNMGEGLGRSTAAGTAIEEFVKKYGRLPDTTSGKDMAEYTRRRNAMNFNMAPGVSPSLISKDTPISLATQFTNYTIKFMELMRTGFEGAITGKERARVAATVIALSGADNLGLSLFGWDHPADMLLDNDPLKEQSREDMALEYAVRHGIVSAAITYAFDSKVNVGWLFNPAGGLARSVDVTKSVYDFMLGPTSSTVQRLLTLGSGMYNTAFGDKQDMTLQVLAMNSMRNGDFLPSTYADGLALARGTMTKAAILSDSTGMSAFLPVFDNTTRAIFMGLADQYVDKYGRVFMKDTGFSKAQVLAQWFGIPPGEVAEYFKMKDQLSDRKATVFERAGLMSQAINASNMLGNPSIAIGALSVATEGLTPQEQQEALKIISKDTSLVERMSIQYTKQFGGENK